MRRTRISLDDIISYENMCHAAFNAAKAKRRRPDVIGFFSDFDENIQRLQKDILLGIAPYGNYRKMIINDPKKRIIHAPSFEDRIAHHAIMNYMGPPLETAMVPEAYACRKGKGPLMAVEKVRKNLKKYPVYAKIDIRKYFDSIDHDCLVKLLLKKFKGHCIPELIRRILGSYQTQPGKGLPIGTLTSQYFANYYLDGLDRYLLEDLKALALVRYMDDIIWWNDDTQRARSGLNSVREFLSRHRGLAIKDSIQVQKSEKGVTFCGFRIRPQALRLTRRKKKRYVARKFFWEKEYLSNRISIEELQRNYSSVFSIISHADSKQWRQTLLTKQGNLEL
jgi:RNA-directed DNA polymerase